MGELLVVLVVPRPQKMTGAPLGSFLRWGGSPNFPRKPEDLLFCPRPFSGSYFDCGSFVGFPLACDSANQDGFALPLAAKELHADREACGRWRSLERNGGTPLLQVCSKIINTNHSF